MKNRLIRWFLALAERFRKPSKADSFLIVSTTGLGDTLWGAPAIRALREAYPDAYIGLLTSPIGQQLFKHCPHLSEIFTFRKPSFFSLFFLYRSLKKKQIGTAFVFHTSQRPILPLCYLIGASRIVGTEKMNKDLDFILTEKLPKKPIHEIARRLEIVGVPADKPFLELFLSDQDREEAETFLNQHEIPPYIPIVGIHPGAKDKFKQWPPDQFIKLGNRLVDALGCQVFVSGSEEERALVEEIASQVRGAIPLAGELSLLPFAALLQKVCVFITNDTGPMHIAYAMNAPTVALFCPTDPKLCGPFFATRVKVIAKQLTCSPCLRKRCRSPFCLLQIGIDEVYEAAIELAHLSMLETYTIYQK